MHILFVHHNFPAQFGQVAAYLVEKHGFRCTFASEQPGDTVRGIERICYAARGGPSERTHPFSRTFESQVWRSHSLYEALRSRPELRPDLVVGHSGFVSTLYLRELYDCPILNYFEYYYRTKDSDVDFRADLPSCGSDDLLRLRTRNAMLLLDLENCEGGYVPTCWQRDQLPREFHAKLRVIFDGIDTSVWKPLDRSEGKTPRRVAGWDIPPGTKIVTYVSRGMESLRGFDIFMKVAKQICDRRTDVLFLVVGEDRIAYGGDDRFTDGRTFKQWVLAQDKYDLSRILFLGRIPPFELARLLGLTDLHIYLTAPFVLSWSLMNALSCGATVIASDTSPVREMIQHGENGLLCDFFDVEQMANLAEEVLANPEAFRPLGQRGAKFIRERYSLDKCLPQMLELYEVALARAL